MKPSLSLRNFLRSTRIATLPRISPTNRRAHTRGSRSWAHRWAACCLSVVLCGSLGCSNSDRPKTIPVAGKITFDGQPPQFPGGIFFAPVEVEQGYPRRGGRALFDIDGEFQATSFEDGDGLVPGTYRVRVESWKEPPSMGKPGVSYVPKGFEAEDLVVSSGEKKIEYNLDLGN